MKSTNETTCSHMYSRSIAEPRPRLCIKCNEPEICNACLGEDTLHMCGKTEPLDTTIKIYTALDMHYAISYAIAHPSITSLEMKEKVENVIDWINESKNRTDIITTMLTLDRWDDLPSRFHTVFKQDGMDVKVINVSRVISCDLQKVKFDYNVLTGDLNCFTDSDNDKISCVITWQRWN